MVGLLIWQGNVALVVFLLPGYSDKPCLEGVWGILGPESVRRIWIVGGRGMMSQERVWVFGAAARNVKFRRPDVKKLVRFFGDI